MSTIYYIFKACCSNFILFILSQKEPFPKFRYLAQDPWTYCIASSCNSFRFLMIVDRVNLLFMMILQKWKWSDFNTCHFLS